MTDKDVFDPTPEADATKQEDTDLSPEDLEQLHPADAADHIEGLDLEDQVKFIKQLPIKDAAESVAEMEKHEQSALIKRLNVGLASRVLEHMSPDDATDILEELDDSHRGRLLRGISPEDRAEISTLLLHDSETAGGVMNTEVVILDQGLSVDQAIAKLRKEVEDKEIPYYAYIVDHTDHLAGVLSMRDLLTSRQGRTLKDMVHDQNLIAVPYDMDKEEVAQLIARYNFLALPVVDHANRLLGVVTVDDIIDIIQEEASEDMQAMVGAAPDETADSPWQYSVKMRLPWLMINMLNSAVSAWVVHFFEGTISQMAVLAVLMPMVANQAGNTGQQALAVMIRQLATEMFDRKRSWIAVFRELKVGMVNSVIVSVLVFLAIFLVFGNPGLAAVMAMALVFDMLVGAIAGASIPLVLKEIGRDPAQASSIFLTTITDSIGFFSFLGLAGLFLVS